MTTLTTANLVDITTIDEDSQLTATLDHDDLEALFASGGPAQLWLDLAVEQEEPRRVTLQLTDADLQALVEGAGGEELTLALDALALADLLQEPEVEAHGMRTGVAVAVAIVAGAAVAPSALGATAQVSPATQPQAVKQAVSSQQVGTAATRQVTRQIVRSQVHSDRASALRLSLLRAGVVR
jgi:hypothetical protein